MGENLLSILHIQKLGHSLEEIRLRALSSIISKYNLGLVDEGNMDNTKMLLEKLVDWFNFERHSEEEKVLSLILRIGRSEKANLILPEIDLSNLLKKVRNLETKIGVKYVTLIEEVQKCLQKYENNSNDVKFNVRDLNGVQSSCEQLNLNNINNNSNRYASNEKCKCKASDINGNKYPLSLTSKESSRTDSSKPERNFIDLLTDETPCITTSTVKTSSTIPSTTTTTSVNSHCNNFNRGDNYFKVEHFPWQSLVQSDEEVLSSVFDGLKYIDDRVSIFQSCQFYSEVVLRDFPPEIFIQRPLIARTLLKLLQTVENDVRVPVGKCLIKTVQCLRNSVKLILTPSVFNQKREFYTTSVYPDDDGGDDGDSFQVDESGDGKLAERIHMNISSLNGDLAWSQGTSTADQKLKRYQLQLPEFCFEVLTSVLPLLRGKCTQEEMNTLTSLSYEFIKCLVVNLKGDIWHRPNDLKDKFFKIFGLLHEILKFHKKHNKIFYVMTLMIVVNLLNYLKPPSGMEVTEILPRCLHLDLAYCIFDSSLYLMFPQLHSDVLKYVKQIAGQQEKVILQDYKDVMQILEAMKSAVTFLKSREKFKRKIDVLTCLSKALPCLDFHQNLDFVRFFTTDCLLQWNRCDLSQQELDARKLILLKLLSHGSTPMKTYTYKEINDNAERLLGEEEASKAHYKYPGDQMDFLFDADVLTEIICHGLSSDVAEVCKYSNNILVRLLKSKFITSEQSWTDFMASLIPCMSLLECFADKSTTLGRCIVKMLDPDVSRSTGLPTIELLKGNIRLLFSKNNLTRDEAISRLFWLLNKEDDEGRKLPRMSVLTSLNLSGICAGVEPVQYSNLQQSFYNPGKLWDVLEVVASEALEPNIRRSALSQLSAMLDDPTLHSVFLEQNGLKKMLKILENCLVEREYRHYPDSVKPIIDILKSICFHNASLCLDLATNINVYYNVLRSLFLFSGDDRLRRNAVELLCLLLYSDCTLRVPADKSCRRIISFPDVVVTKMNLPFLTHTHWRNSKHFEPSIKKSILSKESCAKLVRTYWCAQWVGSMSSLLSIPPSDVKNQNWNRKIPDDLRISPGDIQEMKDCSFTLSLKQTLYDIQNATTHESACGCLHKLQSYLLLYVIDKDGSVNGKTLDVASDTVLSHMLWESTLERFFTSMPTCGQDESLLLQVVRLVQLLLKCFKSDRLVNWMEKLLIDVHKPLYRILKKIEGDNSRLKGRELLLSVIGLIQQVVAAKESLDPKKWILYLDLVSDHLKLDKKDKRFYNVAYVDWLIELLAELTGKCSFSYESERLQILIIRIMEIVIAFHCTQDSTISFMGLNIVKNSLFVLNHILVDTQVHIEEWEELWFRSLSKVIGHVENPNYCWMLSFWFMRDPIARAAGFQLFQGFSTTPKGCDFLMARLSVPFHHVWTEGFRVLLDDRESCIVREKCALLLSNLTSHGTKLCTGSFLEHLEHIRFYEKMRDVIECFQCTNDQFELVLDECNNVFKGEVVTTPSFLTSISVLLLNTLLIDPPTVCDKIMENEILRGLTRVLGDVPESTANCESHRTCIDIIQMYISVCRLMRKCAMTSCKAHTLTVQSQFALNYLYSMINHNLYCDSSKAINNLKMELWCEIFDLFSAILRDDPECDRGDVDAGSGFVALNRCMTDNGLDHFTSSLYLALTTDSQALQRSVLKFLINLFRQEMTSGDSRISVCDIFERTVPAETVALCRATGSRQCDIPEDSSLSFGIRLSDLLLQLFLLNVDSSVPSVKSTVAEALGGLFAVHEPAQTHCARKNFAVSVTLLVKQICVKLSLESAVNLKKLSDRKRIGPMLQDLEIFFRLINNFMYDNEKAKSEIANRALIAVVHKLWPWCVIRPSLEVITLKMLCTFTHFSHQGCRAMVLSSNLTVMCLKKMPGSVTMMNAVINQLTVESDLISKDGQTESIGLCLQLLSNCCSVTECRSVISKGNVLQCFVKLHSGRRKRVCSDAVVESWLDFFIVFSSHQEGQLAVAKNQDLLDVFINMASSSKSGTRVKPLMILRNVCVHQLNRYRMLSCCSFISLLLNVLDSRQPDEVRQVVHTVWTLACNSQKNKVVLRAAGFEVKLDSAKRTCLSMNDSTDLSDLIANVSGILKNK